MGTLGKEVTTLILPRAKPAALVRAAARLPGASIIGRGTGRTVFALESHPGCVLKIASNAMGKAQNEVEARTVDPDFTARLLEQAADYSWILAERLTPLTKDALRTLGVGSPQALESKVLSLFFGSNPDMVELPAEITRVRHYFSRWPQLMPHDICRMSSWGFRAGSLRLLDYGYTYHMNRSRDEFEAGAGGDPLRT